MAIGVGLVQYDTPISHSFASENRNVIEPLDWKVQIAENALGFHAIHDYKDHAYSLTREIILEDREIVVVNVLENCGKGALPLSWFAHPFLPHTKDGVVGDIPCEYRMDEFYSMNANSKLQIKIPDDFSADKYDGILFNNGKVNDDGDDDLELKLNHDLIGELSVKCCFPVEKIPFWYNDKTYSAEPYLIDSLDQNENAQWEIVYKFA